MDDPANAFQAIRRALTQIARTPGGSGRVSALQVVSRSFEALQEEKPWAGRSKDLHDASNGEFR